MKIFKEIWPLYVKSASEGLTYVQFQSGWPDESVKKIAQNVAQHIFVKI
jgi:hypothetical protein